MSENTITVTQVKSAIGQKPKTVIDLFHVQRMVEIDGLFFLGVEQLREDDPSHDEARDESHEEKEDHVCRGLAFLLRIRRRWAFSAGILCGNVLFVLVYSAHGNSVALVWQPPPSVAAAHSWVPENP